MPRERSFFPNILKIKTGNNRTNETGSNVPRSFNYPPCPTSRRGGAENCALPPPRDLLSVHTCTPGAPFHVSLTVPLPFHRFSLPIWKLFRADGKIGRYECRREAAVFERIFLDGTFLPLDSKLHSFLEPPRLCSILDTYWSGSRSGRALSWRSFLRFLIRFRLSRIIFLYRSL